MDRPFPAYTGDEPYIFVSYAHKDSAAVFPEISKLKDQGFNIWYDEGIDAGTEWSEALASAIKRSKLFLFFVSPNSTQSQNCRNEINFAVEQGLPVLAVHLKETELTDGLSLTLSARQAILKYDMPQSEYWEKLVSRIASYLDQQQVQSTPPPNRLPLVVFGTVIVFFVMLGVFFYNQKGVQQEEVAAAPFMPSVTIFPFTSIGSASNLDAKTAGLTEEVIGLVGSYQELQTIYANATSVADTNQSTASYHVAGSIQESDQQLRVRVQLTRTQDGQPVWSKTFDRALRNNFVEQTKLATTIARFVRLQLIKDYQCQVVVRKSKNQQAATHVCAALAENYRINQEGVYDPNILISNGEKAIKLDPTLPEAYVVTTLGYFLRFTTFSAEADARSARHYLEMIPTESAENLLVLWITAVIQNQIDLNYKAAEETAELAIRLHPLHPNIRWMYSIIGNSHSRRGNIEAGIEYYRRALKVYDSDARIINEYARVMMAKGDYEETLVWTNAGLDLNDTGYTALELYQSKISAQLGMGKLEAAMQTLEEAMRGLNPVARGGLIRALVRVGRVKEARTMFIGLQKAENPIRNFLIKASIAFAEHDQAFRLLHQTVEKRGYLLSILRYDPIFDVLRLDPRWPELMAQLERKENQNTY
jgi:TolB-like protein/tetratricopeptide (TPR) repeat protein